MGAVESNERILDVSRDELGKADTLRYNVNYRVLEENYEGAISELENYIKRDFDLPGYVEKIKPYINHCIDLVNAIRAKKGFSKNVSLTRSKQQELHDTIKNHYEELQYAFRKIEQIRHQLQLDDMRSTVWILKAIVYSVMAVVLVVFLKEVIDGAASNFSVVVSDWIDRMVDGIFELIGW